MTDYTPAGKLYKIEVFAPEELTCLSSETWEDFGDVINIRQLVRVGSRAKYKISQQTDFIDGDGLCKTEIEVIEECN
jgi:hypothetical protein